MNDQDAFEEFCAQHGFSIAKRDDGHYASSETSFQWLYWQEARGLVLPADSQTNDLFGGIGGGA